MDFDSWKSQNFHFWVKCVVKGNHIPHYQGNHIPHLQRWFSVNIKSPEIKVKRFAIWA